MAQPVGLAANRLQVRPLRFARRRPSPRRASRCRDETSSAACAARASRPRRMSPALARECQCTREAPVRPPARRAPGTPRRSTARAGPATSAAPARPGPSPRSRRTGSEASIRVGCRLLLRGHRFQPGPRQKIGGTLHQVALESRPSRASTLAEKSPRQPAPAAPGAMSSRSRRPEAAPG